MQKQIALHNPFRYLFQHLNIITQALAARLRLDKFSTLIYPVSGLAFPRIDESARTRQYLQAEINNGADCFVAAENMDIQETPMFAGTDPSLPPCCEFPERFSSFELRPTSRAFEDLFRVIRGLLNQRPLNQKQIEGLENLKTIIGLGDSREGVLPYPVHRESMLWTCAMALDDLLFGGHLKSRLYIVIQPSGALNPHVRATTSMFDYCVYHSQVHSVRIDFNRDCPPPGYGDMRVRTVVATMLHELCHAFIMIFVNKKPYSPRESITLLGLDGHGTLFTELYTMTASFLRSIGCLDIPMEDCQINSINPDRRKQDEIFELWRKIESGDMTRRSIRRKLSQGLNISRRDAAKFYRLLQEGLDIFEVILILGNYTPPSEYWDFCPGEDFGTWLDKHPVAYYGPEQQGGRCDQGGDHSPS